MALEKDVGILEQLPCRVSEFCRRFSVEEFGIELLTILAGTWINFPMPVELQTVKELGVSF